MSQRPQAAMRWFADRKQPLVVAALVVVVILLGLLPATRHQRAKTDVIAAATKLSRGAIITQDDFEVVSRRNPASNVVTRGRDVVGRVALADIAMGAVLHRDDTAPVKAVSGRVPITMAVTSSPSGPTAGQTATVIVSPRRASSRGAMLRQVPVLAVEEKSGERLYTLALTPAEVRQIADLLGVSEVRVSRPY